MKLVIQIDNGGDKIVNGVCAATGYEPNSGIAPEDWVKQIVINQLRDLAKRGALKTVVAESNAAVDAVAIN
jgi:hypothetical protein